MSERERATKRTADTAKHGMPCHQYLQGWQEDRLLHLDQGTRAVQGRYKLSLPRPRRTPAVREDTTLTTITTEFTTTTLNNLD